MYIFSLSPLNWTNDILLKVQRMYERKGGNLL